MILTYIDPEAGKQPAAPLFLDRVQLEGEAGDLYATDGIDIELLVNRPNFDLASVVGAFGDIDFVNGWYPIYVRGDGKVKIIVVSTGAELGSGTDISGLNIEMFLLSQ